MTWVAVPKEMPVTNAYFGFKVGMKGLSLSKELYRTLRKWGWNHVRIEYDPDTWVVRMSKDEDGIRVAFYSITSTIAKFLPHKRFVYKNKTKKYLYFQLP